MSAHSTYTEWHGEMICAGLAEGQSLLATCEALGIPYSTACDWERDIPKHGVNATRAREIGCHALAAQALQIANTPHMGVVRTTKADGGIEEREEDKWLPTVYGDKQQIEHSGSISLAETLREAKAKRQGGT